MDEIFDRIKAIKIKKGQLTAWLIIAETLGILTLVWYLRAPLVQKFLVALPEAYSVSAFDPQKQYLVAQGDLLTGTAPPNTGVKALITPGFLKSSTNSDSEGIWWFQIPSSLNEGVYTVSFGYFDSNGKLVDFQSYKLRVESNIPILNLLPKTNDPGITTLDQFSPEAIEALFKIYFPSN